jgi:hypothetical protein
VTRSLFAVYLRFSWGITTSSMKRQSVFLAILLVCMTLAAPPAADPALAQFIPPGGSKFNPPLPAPLPQPKIEVPVIPKMDALPSQSYASAPGPSFSDRITTCLEEGAAGGLGPSDREEYSRSCANR